MERKNIPFPEEHLTPDERHDLITADKPFLPGAPRAPEESAFAGLNLDAYERILKDSNQFVEKPQAERRRIQQRETLRNLLANPQAYVAYFDTLHISKTMWEDRRTTLEQYEQQFTENFDSYLEQIPQHDPQSLRQWVELAVHSNVYRPQAERILRGQLERCKTTKETINFLYDFASGILETQDKEAYEWGLRVLSFSTDVFSPKSKNLMLYAAALFGGDDTMLQRQQEINSVVAVFAARDVPDAYKIYDSGLATALTSPEGGRIIDQLSNRDPNKAKRLVDYLEHVSKAQGGVFLATDEQIREWPYNLIFHAGPLRRLINQRFEQEHETIVSVSLPGPGDIVFKDKSNEEIRQYILEDLEQKPVSKKRLFDPEMIKALFYLAPDLTPEEQIRLADDVIELRRDTNREVKHLLSDRGDKMIIVDPQLKELGFKSFTFEYGEPSSHTKVTVEVGEYNFEVDLTEDLVLQPSDPQQHFRVSFERRAFLKKPFWATFMNCNAQNAPIPWTVKRPRGRNV
jgi:hypothetical protein